MIEDAEAEAVITDYNPELSKVDINRIGVEIDPAQTNTRGLYVKSVVKAHQQKPPD